VTLQHGGFVRPAAAAAVGAAFFTLSIVGTRDHLEYNRAVWNGVACLRDHGARENEIDGGYPINGWLQYAHPENAPRQDANGGILVPHVNDEFELRYQLSNRPLPECRQFGAFPYTRWLGRSGSIYVGDCGT